MGAFLDAINHEWTDTPPSGNVGPEGQGFGITSSGVIGEEQPSFAERILKTGDASENVEDRRADPQSGYEHMLATNALVGGVTRHEFPKLKSLDFPMLQPKYRKLEAGQLPEQVGIHDILRK